MSRFPLCLSAVLIASASFAQQPPEAQPPLETPAEAAAPVEIADEPKAVDPAGLVPAPLAAKATVEFDEAAIGDVAQWLQQETKLAVIINQRSFEDAGLLISEPVTDRLDDEPIYLLLDRLSQLGVDWRVQGSTLRLAAAADEPVYTTQYNVGDLFDAGHDADTLLDTIETSVAPDSWGSLGGPGDIVVLGDVLFVRQTNQVHRRVAGLLTALRNHGRRTLVSDPPQHDALREALQKPVTVAARKAPLAAVIAQLARDADADLRIDRRALEASGIRDRMPIDLQIAEQTLRVVLDILSQQYSLAWQLRDGVLWIT